MRARKRERLLKEQREKEGVEYEKGNEGAKDLCGRRMFGRYIGQRRVASRRAGQATQRSDDGRVKRSVKIV